MKLWNRCCVCFIDTELEALVYQDEVCLIVNLGKAHDVPSIAFNSWVRSRTFQQTCRERTFHVPIVVSSFGCVTVVFAPVAHLSSPPWNLKVRCAAVVNPGLNRSGMLFGRCVSITSVLYFELLKAKTREPLTALASRQNISR